MFSIEKEKPLIGVVKYCTCGLEVDNIVGFKPTSEYEFIIEGQRLYRVPTNSITINYGIKETKRNIILAGQKQLRN